MPRLAEGALPRRPHLRERAYYYKRAGAIWQEAKCRHFPTEQWLFLHISLPVHDVLPGHSRVFLCVGMW